MIRTVKLKYGFWNASDAQIQTMGGTVLLGMTENAAFPDPPVSMMDHRHELFTNDKVAMLLTTD